jgi:CRISPR-associated endonuclease/helicase Cas3
LPALPDNSCEVTIRNDFVMSTFDKCFNYWGKAGQDGGPAWHALVYHCFDVAATIDRLIARNGRLRNHFVQLSGLPVVTLQGWMRFFAALHDLGKFSSAFQQLRVDLAPAREKSYFYTVRHDSLGYLLWTKSLSGWCVRKDWWRFTDAAESDYLEEVLSQWMQAVTGHHGMPPKIVNGDLRAHFDPVDEEAATRFAEEAARMFLTPEVTQGPLALKTMYRQSKPLSWWLAGLAVLADWLGSNNKFFAYHNDPMPLERYWREIALPAADRVLDDAGILPTTAAGRLGVAGLFNGIVQPTPLQTAALEAEIAGGPYLFLVEDVTGAGKTEAAFILLNRLLAIGAASGAYLALPTMATANAMYRRTARVYRRLFSGEEQPASLVLAHGSRSLDDGFRDSVMPVAPNAGEYDRGEADAGARCNAWLAAGSKRALLAQMGVGTIDQALLAVLTSRHQSLRLLGLLDKVLIVDEVHASDAYMHRLLCELLAAHAKSGGSAVLLSATLPKKMRDELVAAFCDGVGRPVPSLPEAGYPLLTQVGPDDERQEVVATRDSVARTLGFSLFADEQAVLDWVVARAESGSCVAWVRNTVTDAVAAYRALAERLDPARLELFHARFAMGDRLHIEDSIVDTFGATRGARERRGRVVIATQVIEQSLDIDFDEMVSDLAPIDLLLQRAGRLRRHCRDQAGDPIDGDDQRGPATLHVLTPDPDVEADAAWCTRLLPHAAPVYPDHGQLWLTARLIKDRRKISVPGELRGCIEYVFGDEQTDAVPSGLQTRSGRAAGQRSADASLASFNAIKLTEGYRHLGDEWWDESYTPTRLGEPTTTVRLARWDGVSLRPWSDDARYPWAMSEVKVRRALLAEEAKPSTSILANAIELVRTEWPKGAEDALLIPMNQEADNWVGNGVDVRGCAVSVQYSDKDGLRIVVSDSGKE